MKAHHLPFMLIVLLLSAFGARGDEGGTAESTQPAENGGEVSGEETSPEETKVQRRERHQQLLDQAIQARKDKRYSDALELLDAILDEDPDYHEALSERAWVYIVTYHPTKAIPDIERAIQLDPLSKEYLFRRAIAAKYLGQRDEELSWLTKALNQGLHLKALRERIRLEIQSGNYQAALNDYGWLWKHEPSAWATIYKARALLGLGRLDEALAECNKVLVDGKEDERRNWHYVTRAKVYLALGEDEKAYYDLAFSTAEYASTSEALLELGDFFMDRAPDYAKAIAYYTVVIVGKDFREPTTVPEDDRHEPAIARLRRGQAYAALDAKRFAADALEDFARYIQLEPDDAKGYAARARLYAALGEREKAVADWRKAVELDEDNEEYAAELDELAPPKSTNEKPVGSGGEEQ